MKLWIPVVMVVILVMVSAGCVSNNTGQTAGQNARQTLQASGAACTSPYDGTYSGMVSGSGLHNKKSDDGSWTTSPYIHSYNLDVTVVCEIAPGEIPGNNRWFLRVSHAKASDPFFECTNGCTTGVSNNALELAPPGQRDQNNYLEVAFPNGAYLHAGPIFADADAKTIRADQGDHDNLVAWSILGFTNKAATKKASWIENSVCTGDCSYPTQQGFTMTLSKVA
jgi:hypothetical protein